MAKKPDDPIRHEHQVVVGAQRRVHRTGTEAPECVSLYLLERGQHGLKFDGPVAYMGILSVLLEWHTQDPVDDVEHNRNDVVFGFQGNRNPFIDHPEWVACIFAGDCEFCPDPQCPADLHCDGDGSRIIRAAVLACHGHRYRPGIGQSISPRLSV